MTRLLSIALFAPLWLIAQTPAATPPPPLNVNDRYTVEAVELEGVDRDKLNEETRRLLDALVGQKALQEKLDEVVKKLGDEFKKRKVTHKIEKGTKAEHVKVTFVVEPRTFTIAGDSDDLRLIYHSKQNWSFGGTMRINLNKSGFSVLAGALTENDSTVERYSGIRGGAEQKLFHDHLRLSLIGETYRTQWNNAVLAAASPGDIYRTRQNIQPTVEVQILPSLVAKAGFSFQRFEYQFLPAARTLSANSVISTLRFEREWTGTAKHNLAAGYDLRAATKSLGGEFAYARNSWSARYEAKLGPNEFIADARFGVLGGFAPLGERFVLGNSQTLRGWNRFDVAPLGGSRMAHGTAEYRYRGFRFLYDQGAVWQAQDPDPKVRHSLGVGYIDEGITLVVAFPLRNGNVTPLVMLGYTF